MKKLTIDSELTIMKELGINPNELKLIQYILFAQDDNTVIINDAGMIQSTVTPAYKMLFDYLNVLRGNGISLINLVNSLKEKGIINKTTALIPGQSFRPEDVDFNKNKIKKYFRGPQDLFYEIWENYPTSANINGSEVNILNSVLPSIGCNSTDDLAIIYGKKIKLNTALHEEVKELLDWGKESGLINKTLINFILNEEWNILRRMRNEGKVGNTQRKASTKEL